MGFKDGLPSNNVSKETKRKFGMETPIDALGDIVDSTLGTGPLGTTVKYVGAGAIMGGFALLLGATAPIAGAVAGATVVGAAIKSALGDD